MQFLSLPFFCFLGGVVFLFNVAPARWRIVILLTASYAFYAAVEWHHAVLLLALSLFTFGAGTRLAPASESRSNDARRAQLLLFVTITLVASALFVFKYDQRILRVPARLLGLAPAASTSVQWTDLLLPLGISYYTFKLIAYLVEVYWGRLEPCRNLVSFLVYPVFFPQIVSGPIQRPGPFFEQISRSYQFDRTMFVSGLRLILFGLFEKLVVADRLAVIVSNVFENPHGVRGLGFLIGAYAFAFQLYADFCGISDIAIGMGRLVGISAPPNFASPFYAGSIQAFWQRWHMSLTSWLSDYVFTPLRMLLRNWGNWGLALCIAVNMIAIALWHGATWTYLVFGAINAALMIVHVFGSLSLKAYYKSHPTARRIRDLLSPLIVFHCMVVALVFFRAQSVADGAYVLKNLLPFAGLPRDLGLSKLGLVSSQAYLGVLACILMEAVHFGSQRTSLQRWFQRMHPAGRLGMYYALAMILLVFGEWNSRVVIYQGF